MKYKNIVKGTFISRPNRFIANVEIDGQEEVCHVKNTGRCKELLMPGAQLFLQYSDNPARKTKYDVIGVIKNQMMVNMDSQIPNKVVYEWIKKGNLFSKNAILRPEKSFGNSRLDLYVEDGARKAFIEVKGVTLEVNGVARFPDAPTERGIKHIQELCECINQGYEAYILFVIQMKGVYRLEPNWITHRAFGEALKIAREKGVQILAYDCLVTEDSIEIDQQITFSLYPEVEDDVK